ncbi:PEP-CTERM protein-sorting domain-containing protein [Alteromonadaceae bacterium Bs31]|nr:PEP-CTERM protein-sorting domain-containing protein [Alteromonadaceae bacterium Bs31]
MNFKQLFAGLVLSFVGASANAVLIDFTDENWATSAPGVTVTANPDQLTFNQRDRGGCVLGQSYHNLACDGDGIGVVNDEISEIGNNNVHQSITVDFGRAVNVSNVFLLDLFASERGERADLRQIGEIAVIDGITFQAVAGGYNVGGFWDTGFSAAGITSLKFTGYNDLFSDYAIAAIEVSPVPLPGSLVLMGSVLMGLGMYRRKKKVT